MDFPSINFHIKEVQSFEERFGADVPFNPNKIFSFLVGTPLCNDFNLV
jgi:hypothetical protein